MKHIMRVAIVAALLCIGLIAGCASNSQDSTKASGSAASGSAASQSASGAIKVVCATFPAYDWVNQVIGDAGGSCEVTYLMGSGVDLHSFQPTVDDIAKITDADLFVYVGGGSDEWAADAVKAAANPNLRTVNMLEAMGDAAVEEEIVEGMQAEEHHEHADGEAHEGESAHEEEHASETAAESEAHEGESAHEEEHASETAAESEAHEEEHELDEHVWLSLKNAQVLVDAIANELSEINPEGASTYTTNAKAYKAELAKLDSGYADAVKAGSKNTILFADRFPFRYLVDDYGLSYYAAFVGCSAETEASFETVAFLAKKVDELGIKDVLVIENSDQKIAQTVIQNTESKDQKILVMDSLQSTTDADIAAGKTYLSAMQANLDVLTEALA